MQTKHTAAIYLLFLTLSFTACSKKHHPQTEATGLAVEEKKPVARKVVKTAVPKVITVDDRGAKKAVDGRLYYDLEGHRYWKNYDDGKYYIFSSKMSGDPAYTPH